MNYSEKQISSISHYDLSVALCKEGIRHEQIKIFIEKWYQMSTVNILSEHLHDLDVHYLYYFTERNLLD